VKSGWQPNPPVSQKSPARRRCRTRPWCGSLPHSGRWSWRWALPGYPEVHVANVALAGVPDKCALAGRHVDCVNSVAAAGSSEQNPVRGTHTQTVIGVICRYGRDDVAILRRDDVQERYSEQIQRTVRSKS
jgi:hypothetical protein